MAVPLKFVPLSTGLKGLMVRAVETFDRYLDEDPSTYQWVCVDNPEVLAPALELLAQDMPEPEIAEMATKFPYLMLLFHKPEDLAHIPVEASVAFLAVLNRAHLVTVLRQCSGGKRLAAYFGLDAEVWQPVFFLMGGVPDLDNDFEDQKAASCSFFLKPNDESR